MKISKQMQYGLLLMLYLCRSGRTTIDSACEGLKVPKSFLVQIANNLRKAGVIKSTKGPNGGYELVGSPTVRDVFNALEPIELLSSKEVASYIMGEVEHRALAHYIQNMTLAMHPILNRKIRDVEKQVTVMELAYFDRMISAEVN